MTGTTWLINWINNYNAIGYGEVHVYETPSSYIIWIFNTGFSENEDMDSELRLTQWKNYIEVDAHPIMCMRLRKLNLRRRLYDASELEKLKETEHYHKVKKYRYKYEVD